MAEALAGSVQISMLASLLRQKEDLPNARSSLMLLESKASRLCRRSIPADNAFVDVSLKTMIFTLHLRLLACSVTIGRDCTVFPVPRFDGVLHGCAGSTSRSRTAISTQCLQLVSIPTVSQLRWHRAEMRKAAFGYGRTTRLSHQHKRSETRLTPSSWIKARGTRSDDSMQLFRRERGKSHGSKSLAYQ